ncbi:MAG: MarR family transcriptional regulator [Pseudomonadota bacterium]
MIGNVPNHPDDRLLRDVHVNLLRTHDFLEHEFALFFSSFGVSGPQFNVLTALRRYAAKGLPLKKISGELAKREPDVTRLVDRLEKIGLVDRKRCSKDRRVVWVRLRPAGNDLVEKIGPGLAELRRKLFGRLGPDRVAALNALLLEIRSPDGPAPGGPE